VTLDPRTPVIVGVGQHIARDATLENALEPVALMERAVVAAASDAGLDGPPPADSIRVVNVIGWRYRNAPRFVAERLGIRDAELVYSTGGGNTPQSFVNRTSRDILEGGLDIADADIPATLQASLLERLDRLGEAKEIAQIGAVIGREVPHALLAAVAEKSVPQIGRAHV
jgi:hypothetical protein